MTRTYAHLNVPSEFFEYVKKRLIEAGYGHAILDDGDTLDMHGIALVTEPSTGLSDELKEQIDEILKAPVSMSLVEDCICEGPVRNPLCPKAQHHSFMESTPPVFAPYIPTATDDQDP